jgi:hypothetical protein
LKDEAAAFHTNIFLCSPLYYFFCLNSQLQCLVFLVIIVPEVLQTYVFTGDLLSKTQVLYKRLQVKVKSTHISLLDNKNSSKRSNVTSFLDVRCFAPSFLSHLRRQENKVCCSSSYLLQLFLLRSRRSKRKTLVSDDEETCCANGTSLASCPFFSSLLMSAQSTFSFYHRRLSSVPSSLFFFLRFVWNGLCLHDMKPLPGKKDDRLCHQNTN